MLEEKDLERVFFAFGAKESFKRTFNIVEVFAEFIFLRIEGARTSFSKCVVSVEVFEEAEGNGNEKRIERRLFFGGNSIHEGFEDALVHNGNVGVFERADIPEEFEEISFLVFFLKADSFLDRRQNIHHYVLVDFANIVHPI